MKHKMDNRRGVLFPTVAGDGPDYHGRIKFCGIIYTLRAWNRLGRDGRPYIEMAAFAPDKFPKPHNAEG